MSHKTLIITSCIFVVIILVGVIISFTLLLHPNTPNRGGVASTSTQTTQSLVSVVPQRVVLGVLPNPHNSSTQMLPADTLVWETYTLSNTTILVGAEIAIVILPQNYNSNITLAVYVNGTLLKQETYKIPPPIGNDNSSSFVHGGTGTNRKDCFVRLYCGACSILSNTNNCVRIKLWFNLRQAN